VFHVNSCRSYHAAGVELAKLPPAKGGNPLTKKAGSKKDDPPSLKESVGSRTRGTRLKKLGSTPKDVVEAAVEKLADEGKDVTVRRAVP
jgi:hypothetical protein